MEWTFTTRRAAQRWLDRRTASCVPMTYKQIGRIFGITSTRVRQIERSALRKLARHHKLRQLAEEIGE